MSHFSVMVIGNNIEEQLAPYQENNMGDCPEEYLEFNDCTEEVLDKWENGKIKGYFSKKGFEYDFNLNNKKSKEYPYSKVYKNKDDFAFNYFGYKKYDDKYGYYFNPNAKWDWYTLGGRWSNFLKLKNNENVNQAKKKDIAFEDMTIDSYNEAKQEYEEIIENIFNGSLGDYKPWKYFKEQNIDLEEKRKLYWNQEQLLKIKDLKKNYYLINGLDLFYNKTKEEFAQEAANSSISTFAFVKDGIWYEKGEMGWWAIVKDEKQNWDKEFIEMLNEVDDESLISIIDCHI